MTAPLVVTPGDPEGIGPEVVVGALVRRESEGSPVNCVLVGDGEAIRRAAWILSQSNSSTPNDISSSRPAALIRGPVCIEMRDLRHLIQVNPSNVEMGKQKCCKTKIFCLAECGMQKKRAGRCQDCTTRVS